MIYRMVRVQKEKDGFASVRIAGSFLVEAIGRGVFINENGDYEILVPNYVEENVNAKVMKLIRNLTNVVNKMVWRKTN